MKTETQDRFEEKLKEFNEKIGKSRVTFNDAEGMYGLCYNLLLRYEEIRDSRDKWRNKYNKLKNKNGIRRKS